MWYFIFSKKNNAAIQVNALALRTEFARRRPKTVPNGASQQRTVRQRHCERSDRRKIPPATTCLRRLGLIAIAIGCLTCTDGQAQTRSLPSHGKIKIDSYNYLMRDVHPASQCRRIICRTASLRVD